MIVDDVEYESSMELHLAPLHGITQLRPSYEYLGKSLGKYNEVGQLILSTILLPLNNCKHCLGLLRKVKPAATGLSRAGKAVQFRRSM